MAILYGLLFCSFSTSAMYLSGLIPLAFVFEIVLCASLILIEPSEELEDPPRVPSAFKASLCCATIGFRMDCLREEARASVFQVCRLVTGQDLWASLRVARICDEKVVGQIDMLPILSQDCRGDVDW